jgi:hypothetical protein
MFCGAAQWHTFAHPRQVWSTNFDIGNCFGLPMVRRMSKTLPTDFMAICPTVKVMSDGRLCIRFEGGMFPSLLGKLFGLTLTSETTPEDAEALAAQLACSPEISPL